MADKPNQSKRRIRPAQTVRQQAQETVSPKRQPRRLRRAIGQSVRPFKAAHRAGQKEYYLPIPDGKIGRFLNKRRSFIPSYFRNSFRELKEVRWPNRKQTTQLTLAVFIFAFIFGFLIT